MRGCARARSDDDRRTRCPSVGHATYGAYVVRSQLESQDIGQANGSERKRRSAVLLHEVSPRHLWLGSIAVACRMQAVVAGAARREVGLAAPDQLGARICHTTARVSLQVMQRERKGAPATVRRENSDGRWQRWQRPTFLVTTSACGTRDRICPKASRRKSPSSPATITALWCLSAAATQNSFKSGKNCACKESDEQPAQS